MTNAISVSGLVKNFGHVRALDGLDLEVATGEVHGFLGPNGAGKTTTIRVLLGRSFVTMPARQPCWEVTRGQVQRSCIDGWPMSPGM